MKTTVLFSLLLLAVSSYGQQSPSSQQLDVSPGLFGGSYFFGNKEISKTEFKQILFTNEKAKKEYQQGVTLSIVGRAIGIVSAGYLGYGIGSETINAEGYIAGGAGFVLGLSFIGIGGHNLRKSLKTYNDSSKNITLQVLPTNNGLTLAMNF